MEAAVLLEAEWDKIVDEVWVVMVPENTAKERLMARNSLAEEEALKRIRSQMTNGQRIARAHVVLSNHRDAAATHAQVEVAWEGVAARSKMVLGDSLSGALQARWANMCSSFAVPVAVRADWWRKLRFLYMGPGRFYHT